MMYSKYIEIPVVATDNAMLTEQCQEELNQYVSGMPRQTEK